MGLHVTSHALIRYQQRVRPCSDDEAFAALSNERIRRAIAFGAKYIRLGTGHRIVVENEAIVTVLPLECRQKMHRMRRDNADE